MKTRDLMKTVIFYFFGLVLALIWTAIATEWGSQTANYIMTFIPSVLVYSFVIYVILEKQKS